MEKIRGMSISPGDDLIDIILSSLVYYRAIVIVGPPIIGERVDNIFIMFCLLFYPQWTERMGFVFRRAAQRAVSCRGLVRRIAVLW